MDGVDDDDLGAYRQVALEQAQHPHVGGIARLLIGGDIVGEAAGPLHPVGKGDS